MESSPSDESHGEGIGYFDTDDADDAASPIERPPSCPPALLAADDEFRDAYVANQLAIFHRDLCERLEQVVRTTREHASSRKRKRGSDTSDDDEDDKQSLPPRRRRQQRRTHHRDNTPDSLTTATTRSSVDSIGTVCGDTTERVRFTHDTYASPVSSLSPVSWHGDAPVKGPDFSWWRPLTPTPPATPKVKQSDYGTTLRRGKHAIDAHG